MNQTQIAQMAIPLVIYESKSVFFTELSPNTSTSENVTIKERESKTLTCTATGNPIPMLRWYFVPLPEVSHVLFLQQ